MSNSETTLDFSHLDEETETDGPAEPELGRHSLDSDVQPHLSLPPPPSTTNRRNPRDRGRVDVDETRSQRVSQVQSSEQPASPATVEVNERSFDHNSNHINNSENHADSQNNTNSTATANTAENPSAIEAPNPSNSVQICYSKNTGNIGVRQVPVVTRPDGTPYIATQQISQEWEENERRPLRKKRIFWIKFFSIIACIIYFPIGIPAVYFAFRIDKEFEEGILRGNIDRAQKFATRSERLSILSVVMCILTAALVVTLIEKPQFEHHYKGTITG